ncbi:MAG: NAD(+)/NADH kinase [Actinobacteria bacterium]|nr:NAD(+)/NADH kinase [Actinomycetota bacterium]
MRAAVITHHFPHEHAIPAIARLRELAAEHDCELLFDEMDTTREHLPVGERITPVADFGNERIDVSIVLGGDGSILRSLRTFAGTGVPTFGFNFGTIGFLTTVEPDELDDGIRRALTGDYDVLRLPALRMRYADLDFLAVNDVAFDRPRDARVAEIAYALAGEPVGRVRCDGVVAATPAGSTGYNLANSGPILAWGVAGYVVSFIAPHTLTARAMVAAPGDPLAVTNAGRIDELEIMIDGLIVGTLPVGATADLTFENDLVALAQLPGSSFYQRFRDKFGKLAS